MQKDKTNLSYAITGAIFGLTGIYLGVFSSSAIEATPFNLGITSAVYCAIATAIIAGITKK